MEPNNLTLKVLEAYTRDVGRGVARIDYDSMDSLGASTGDVIEIKGKRFSFILRTTVQGIRRKAMGPIYIGIRKSTN